MGMDMIDTLPLLRTGDYVAVAILLLAWAGMTWWIERTEAATPSVTVLMERYRRDWMDQMITRESRAFDATTLGNLRQGTAFFASGSLIALGGVLALAGRADQLATLIDEVAFLNQDAAVWQLKLVVAALLLTHGFLKFVWANRLFGYCSVVIAAAPNDPGDARCATRARQAADINIRAAAHLNRGLRSVYYALTVLAWLLGWGAMIAAVIGASYVLWHREFASASRAVLLEE